MPPQGKALLLLRVLGYDRALERRCGGGVVVAVPWQVGEEQARDELVDALRSAADRFTVSGHRVRVVPVRVDRSDPAERIREAGACVAFLLDPARLDIPSLTRQLAAQGVLSVSGDRTSVEGGVAIGLLLSGARAAVLVDVAAARAAGADLDASLFTVAETVGPHRSPP